MFDIPKNIKTSAFAEVLVFSNMSGFSSGKLGPKMDQNCKIGSVRFEPNCKILIYLSNNVFLLLETTSSQNISKINQCLGE